MVCYWVLPWQKMNLPYQHLAVGWPKNETTPKITINGLYKPFPNGMLVFGFTMPKPTTSNKIWTCSDGKYQECPVQLGLSASPNCSQVSDVSGIVYQDDDHAVFTAPSHGKFASVHFNVENQPRTIRFKALNAAARQAAAEDAQTRRQLFRPSTRAE